MKGALSIWFIFSWFLANAQTGQVNITSQTRQINITDAPDAETLAKALSRPDQTEMEKVKSIFYWITDNIGYHATPWNKRYNPTSKYEVEDPSDTSTILKPLDERIADLVIRRREAFCDGYARLFKTLCNFSGIQAAVITGYSPIGSNRNGSKFKSNHTWNAVRINNTWHLLDVTWASGFLTYSGTEFVKRYDGNYFLTPPPQFINDHYPEDLNWTLLPQPPALREFSAAPYKQQGYVRAKISGYKPEKGTVDASIGDTLYFELASNDELDKQYDNFSFFDTTFQQPDAWTYIKPIEVFKGKIKYAYPVQSNTVQYLNLVFNDQVVIRYRVDIKETGTASISR